MSRPLLPINGSGSNSRRPQGSSNSNGRSTNTGGVNSTGSDDNRTRSADPVLNSGQSLDMSSVFDGSSIADLLNIPELSYNGDDALSQIIQYLRLYAQDNDANFALGQLLLQMFNNDLNYKRNQQNSQLAYERSLASNQVALMMSAGMSHAAALAALQNGGSFTPTDATGDISPLSTNQVQNRTNRINSIFGSMTSAVQVANQISSLASLPFDLDSKRITNRLLTNQNDLQSMQLQGMQDAAMFVQAVANSSSSHPDLVKLPISDQYKFFQDQSKMKPMEDGFSPSAFYYGNSQSFARAAQNPYFWSTLSDSYRNRNLADASVFEPEKAQSSIAQVRALSELVQNQQFTEQMRGKILSVQAFHDEYLKDIQTDVDELRLYCESHQIQFDDAKAKAFIQRVNDFTELDFQNLDLALKRVSYCNDADVFEKWKNELTESLDYNVANYIYGKSLASLKNGVLQQLLPLDNQGNVDFSSNNDVLKWTRDYIKYNEFGYGAKVNAVTSGIRTGASLATGAAATLFAGYKLFGNLGSSAVNGFVTSSTSSFAPVFAPLVPSALPSMRQDLMTHQNF